MKQSDAQAKYKEFRDKIAATEKPGLIGKAVGIERLQLKNDLNHFKLECSDCGITLLEPCPFCGSYNIFKYEDQELQLAYQICSDCSTEGPPSPLKEKEKAIAAWNTRVN